VNLMTSTQEAATWGWDRCHLLRSTSRLGVPARSESHSPWCQGWQHTALWQWSCQTWSVHSIVDANVDADAVSKCGLCKRYLEDRLMCVCLRKSIRLRVW